MTDTGPALDLPEFPFRGDSLTPAEYAQRRGTCPFGQVRLPSGDPAILLVTSRDVAAAMAEPRLSHDLTGPDAARMTAEPSFFRTLTSCSTRTGGPPAVAADHRRRVHPRRAERWKPVIRQVAGELIDDLEQAGRRPIWSRATASRCRCASSAGCWGCPRGTRGGSGLVECLLRRCADDPEEVQAEIGAFLGYMSELIAARRAQPGADLIDDLISARTARTGCPRPSC